MTKAKSPVPPGYRTATPTLVVHDGAKALEFYEKALGAKVQNRAPSPDGKVWHAELIVGDSMVMVADEFPGSPIGSPSKLKGTTLGMWVYVPDVDATFKRAVAAGAKSVYEPNDMFWGDRTGTVIDPFGHVWNFATHIEDPTPEEMEQKRAAFVKQMGERS
jgi:PhnB protein